MSKTQLLDAQLHAPIVRFADQHLPIRQHSAVSHLLQSRPHGPLERHTQRPMLANLILQNP